MELYLIISLEVRESVTVYDLPEGIASPLPIGKEIIIVNSKPTEIEGFHRKLNKLINLIGNLKLSFEGRHNLKARKLGELKLNSVFVEKLDGFETYYINTGLLEYPEPEVMFKWDEDVLASKYSIKFLSEFVKLSETPFLISLLDDGTRLSGSLGKLLEPPFYLCMAYINHSGEYKFLSRAQPLWKGDYGARDIGLRLACRLADYVEVIYVKEADLYRLNPFNGSLTKVKADVIYLLPSKEEYPLLHKLAKLFEINSYFSYSNYYYQKSKQLLISPYIHFFNIKDRLGTLTDEFEDYVESGRTLRKCRLGPLIYSKRAEGPSPPCSDIKPSNLDELMESLREGERVALIYSFYWNPFHQLSLTAKLRKLLPIELRNKSIRHLVKLREIRLYRELNRLRIEGTYGVTLRYLLSSPPYPSEIILIDRGERLYLTGANP
ncbi:MAG: hypothetical protein B6U69_03320 [Thermofilum sp. ex4484_15]|nr:MAG: hypothetical protein B6U69_03320 [Thermofilum sp. ex4484_15]